MRNSAYNKKVVLKLARWLIEHKGWIKDTTCDAHDADGNPTDMLGADAVKWSLFGAIAKAEQLHWCNSTYSSGAYEYVRAYLQREFRVDFTSEFNNHHVVELEDILICLDRCIQELETVLT